MKEESVDIKNLKGEVNESFQDYISEETQGIETANPEEKCS